MTLHPHRATRQPIGALSAVYAVFALAVAALHTYVALRHESLLVRGVIDRPFAIRAAAVLAGVLAFELGAGLALLRRHVRRPRHSPGRARFIALSFAGLTHAGAAVIASVVAARNVRARDLVAGFGLQLPSGDAALIGLAAAVSLAAAVAMVGSALAAWPLLSLRARARIFVGVDAVLAMLFAFAVALLPTQPASDAARDLAPPIARHVVTTLFALRLLARLLPTLLDVIERIGFQMLVAARHLRSRKSGFLAAISLLSILAVTVSSCALTTTLSVMGGFRNDLKRKILGNNAHIVIDRDRATIEGWAPLVKAAAETEGVAGASPFVTGEVMLSSATNLATAILRGVDPQTVGRANDLPRNLKTGRLEYLEHPEKLLELPPVASSFPGPPGTLRIEGGGAELEKKLEDLDAFLRKSSRVGDGADAPRDVLPGIIIGQELARALRLYLGDEVNVVSPLGALGPSGPMPKSRTFRVAGVFYSGMYEYDMKLTYVALTTAQRFLNVGHAISGVEIKVRNVDAAPLVAGALRRTVGRPELRVRDWQELNRRLFGALALEKLAMFVALGIAILVASFCIAGTLTLMVQEKGREVAILKAMGTSDRTVVSVFVIEGGLIGVLGATLGLFLGYMVCFAAEHFGIRMNPEVYYIDRLPVHIDPTELAWTGVASIAVCLVVTIYPALMASRLRPVDALRYE